MLNGMMDIELLLVEDNDDDVVLFRELLNEIDWPVNLSLATDGDVALQLLRRQGAFSDAPCPTVVLLDINLPRTNGFDVLEAMRRDAALARIPVVCLTTSRRAEDAIRAYSLGAARYLSKPFSRDDLEELLARHALSAARPAVGHRTSWVNAARDVMTQDATIGNGQAEVRDAEVRQD